jgi:hypothetical protein
MLYMVANLDAATEAGYNKDLDVGDTPPENPARRRKYPDYRSL